MPAKNAHRWRCGRPDRREFLETAIASEMTKILLGFFFFAVLGNFFCYALLSLCFPNRPESRGEWRGYIRKCSLAGGVVVGLVYVLFRIHSYPN
jgi:hypothetical protein